MKIYSSVITGSLKIKGDIEAENYIVNTTVTALTQSFSSGSTIFGDSADDTHQFSGSLFISGSSIALGDGNNNVVLGRNEDFNIISQYSTFIGYHAAGGTESTGLVVKT